MAKTTQDYQKQISNPLKANGWKLGTPINAGEGFKVPLVNKRNGLLVIAAHAGMDNSQWKFYGPLQDIHAWETIVNMLTDTLVIREFVQHVTDMEDDDSMKSDTPQEIVMNVLWVDKHSK